MPDIFPATIGAVDVMKKLSMIAFLTGFVAQVAVAYEQPTYTVVASMEGYELRAYDAYLVAEATVDGNMDEAGNEAFRILGGYIFGGNKRPEAAGRSGGEPASGARNEKPVKMKMTVPVTSFLSSIAPERSTFQFVMERAYDPHTLPIPNDPRVVIRELPPATIAARRYSGRTTKRNFDEHLRVLSARLAADGYTTVGKARAAVYNGPFTLPFMRRNEVLIEVIQLK